MKPAALDQVPVQERALVQAQALVQERVLERVRVRVREQALVGEAEQEQALEPELESLAVFYSPQQ